MKTLYSTRDVIVPDGVTVVIKSRIITVTGPLGTITREFKDMSVDIQPIEKDGQKVLKVDVWFGNREAVAALRTTTSNIENMITGVTVGFKYIMRCVYAHFPINVASSTSDKGEVVEIRNFLGDKRVRKVQMLEGVKYTKTADVKDQIEISGIDITKVSLSCALIRQACNVRKKDLRKFLDGIYVSSKGPMVVEE
jgi:large subunit ribosomal protein L9e